MNFSLGNIWYLLLLLLLPVIAWLLFGFKKWKTESPTKETAYIIKKAMRTIEK